MRKGFTVTEILITVVVFALLLGFTVPKFLTLVHKAQEGSTKHKLVKVRSAIAAYYGEHQGTYPTDDLTSLVPAYIEKFRRPPCRAIRPLRTCPPAILNSALPKPAAGRT